MFIVQDVQIASISEIYNDEEGVLLKKSYSHKSCSSSLLYQTSQSSLELYQERIDPIIDGLLSKGYGIPNGIPELNACLVEAKPDFRFYNHLIKSFTISLRVYEL